MKSVFVIFGETGEYSDHQAWTVEAWSTREQAEARVAEIRRTLVEAGFSEPDEEEYQTNLSRHLERLAQAKAACGDSKLECQYIGTRYLIEEIPLRGVGA